MGSRSASKVPAKRGNGRGTPWREERHRGTEPLEGQAARTPIRGPVLTQLWRIASRREPVTPTSRMRQRARPDPWEAWAGNRPGPPGKHGYDGASPLISVLCRPCKHRRGPFGWGCT